MLLRRSAYVYNALAQQLQLLIRALQVEQRKKKKEKKAAETPKDSSKEEPEDTTANEAVEDAPEPANDDDSKDNAVENTKPDDDKADEDGSSSAAPSLAQQSKLRSTSFRAGSGSGPASPGPFSPDGDTAPDIYRKHVARIEELEKENKRLTKDHSDSEKRWKKAEDELADLREADGEKKKANANDQSDKLVGWQHQLPQFAANNFTEG